MGVRQSFSISETLLVRTTDPDVFAVGTVEGHDGDAYLVSYPLEWIGRRAEPVLVKSEDALRPDAIDPGPEKDPSRPMIMLAGTRYLCDIDNIRFRLVECRAECAISTAAAFLAQPLAVEPSGATVHHGNEMLVPLDRTISRPIDLARIRQEQFMAPVDPLFDVYATPVFERWTWRGLARALFPRTTIEGELLLKIRGHRISARISYQHDGPKHFKTEELQGMNDGILEPLEVGSTKGETAITWRADGVLFKPGGYRYSASEGSKGEPGTLLISKLDVTFATDAPTITREIFEGAAFEQYTHFIEKRMSARSFRIPDAIRTSVFGKPATMYTPPREDKLADTGPVPRIGVVYVGDPCADVEFEALASLLGYLKGGRLRHLSTERFNTARRTSYQRISRSARSKTLTPPVPLGPFDRDVLFEIAAQFPAMLGRLSDAFKVNHNAVSTVLHHYAEARGTGYPTTSIILISVAIDSLISFMTGDAQSNDFIVDASVYAHLEPYLQGALAEAYSKDETLAKHPDARARFERNISGSVNKVSNTKRLVQFWIDAGVRLTKSEVELLRKRHPALHKGYVQKELDSTVLEQTYEDAARLANLFNRAFLARVLRYEGPVLDATFEGRLQRRRLRISDGLEFGEQADDLSLTTGRLDETIDAADEAATDV